MSVSEESVSTVSEESVGRALFGRSTRMRVGIWIARLQGEPPTFCQRDFVRWCIATGKPSWMANVRTDLDRFASLGMVRLRADIDPNGRARYWSREPNALWDVFLAADAAIAYLQNVPARVTPVQRQRVRHAVDDLVKLREELADG